MFHENQTYFYLLANFSLPIPRHTISYVLASRFVCKVCTVLLICRERSLGLESYRCCWVCLVLLINETKPNAFVSDRDCGGGGGGKTVLNHLAFLSSSFTEGCVIFSIWTLKIPLRNAIADEGRRKRWSLSCHALQVKCKTKEDGGAYKKI